MGIKYFIIFCERNFYFQTPNLSIREVNIMSSNMSYICPDDWEVLELKNCSHRAWLAGVWNRELRLMRSILLHVDLHQPRWICDFLTYHFLGSLSERLIYKYLYLIKAEILHSFFNWIILFYYRTFKTQRLLPSNVLPISISSGMCWYLVAV